MTCRIIFSSTWLACNPALQLSPGLCKYNSRKKPPFVPLGQEDMSNVNVDAFLKTKLLSVSLLTDFIAHLFSVKCSYLQQSSQYSSCCLCCYFWWGSILSIFYYISMLPLIASFQQFYILSLPAVHTQISPYLAIFQSFRTTEVLKQQSS